MLGLLAPRKDYFHIGRYQARADMTELYNFRFKIVQSDNSVKQNNSNMEGRTGTFVIETKSGLDFQPNDLIHWRGMRFSITTVDGDMTKVSQAAFVYIKNNGNIPIALYLRKEG